jgi:hypothetical protein
LPPPRATEARVEAVQPTTAVEGERSGTAWKWAGGVIAAAGAVAIGVGGTLALVAKSDYDSVSASCGPRGCTLPAYDARNDARSKADIATLVMGLGGAAFLGGVLVWVLAPAGGQGTSDTGRSYAAIGPASVSVVVPY